MFLSFVCSFVCSYGTNANYFLFSSLICVAKVPLLVSEMCGGEHSKVHLWVVAVRNHPLVLPQSLELRMHLRVVEELKYKGFDLLINLFKSIWLKRRRRYKLQSNFKLFKLNKN